MAWFSLYQDSGRWETGYPPLLHTGIQLHRARSLSDICSPKNNTASHCSLHPRILRSSYYTTCQCLTGLNRVSVLFGHVMVGIFLYASYFLCLIKCTPSPELAVKSLWHKAKWAIGVVSNPRGIGTEWQIRNLPPFSRKDKGYVPSRRSFLVQRIAGFVCFYLLGWVYPQLIALLPLRVEDFESSKLRLFSLSTGELLVRVCYAVDAFLLLYIRHNTLHWLVSAIAVLLGDSPERWPPLFGDIRDAYTLRRFWGYVPVSRSLSLFLCYTCPHH